MPDVDILPFSARAPLSIQDDMEPSRPMTSAVEALPSLGERLTPEEDEELRRLNFFEMVGELSNEKKERLIELRLRDRRQEIRAPRDSLVNEEGSTTSFRVERH